MFNFGGSVCMVKIDLRGMSVKRSLFSGRHHNLQICDPTAPKNGVISPGTQHATSPKSTSQNSYFLR